VFNGDCSRIACRKVIHVVLAIVFMTEKSLLL